jgi:hypothetical protein
MHVVIEVLIMLHLQVDSTASDPRIQTGTLFVLVISTSVNCLAGSSCTPSLLTRECPGWQEQSGLSCH